MKQSNSKVNLPAMLAELRKARETQQSSQFLTALDRILNASALSKSWDVGDKAVQESHEAWESGLLANDDLFLLIRHVSNYYLAASNHEAVISLYLQAADRFADFEAFQSAYRILSDAEEYANEHCGIHDNLRVKDRFAEICITEGDLNYAAKVIRSLKKLRRRFQLETPIGLEINYGNLQLRKTHYGPALKSFKRGLDPKQPSDLRLVCLMNSSICLRELEKYAQAEKYLGHARALIDESTDSSHLIELDLVEAKTCVAMAKFTKAAECLHNAVGLIDRLIASAGRLHYRRGIRQRYRTRVAHILQELPRSGNTETVLPIIAFLKGNSSSDWLALLDWRASLAWSDIPTELKERFENALAGVAAAGAPVLYGYREKYDEPWATGWTPDEETFSSVSFAPVIPWADLNTAIIDICTLTVCHSPWAAALSSNRSTELLQAMGQTGRIFAQTFTTSVASIYLISSSEYERIELPTKEVSELSVRFTMHKAGMESSQEFRQRLGAFTDKLGGLLATPLDKACQIGLGSIIILPELIFYPVSGAITAHKQVRSLMLEGHLTVRICPILHVTQHVDKGLNTVSACDVEGDILKLNHAELSNVSRILAPANVVRDTLSGRDATKSLFENDILHVAAHGTPLSNLRDAFFSPENSDQPLSNFYGLQWSATKSRSKIVFLNSCFSADTINWNVMQGFKTNEQIGLSSMFLLNRKAIVIATAWGTFDSAAYIFAQLFYQAVANGAEPAIAFAKACASLHDMDVESVRESLATVRPAGLAQEKQAIFRGVGNPFSHPYVAGNYLLLSLLPSANEA